MAKYLPPGTVADLFEQYAATRDLLAAPRFGYKTFLQIYKEEWSDVLKFRDKNLWLELMPFSLELCCGLLAGFCLHVARIFLGVTTRTWRHLEALVPNQGLANVKFAIIFKNKSKSGVLHWKLSWQLQRHFVSICSPNLQTALPRGRFRKPPGTGPPEVSYFWWTEWTKRSLSCQGTLVKGLYPQWISAGSKLWLYICYGIPVLLFFESIVLANFHLGWSPKQEIIAFSPWGKPKWKIITSCYGIRALPFHMLDDVCFTWFKSEDHSS